MTKTAILFILLISSITTAVAQVDFKVDPQVQRMIEGYIQMNKDVENIRGWRIQISALDDRREMERSKARFERDFPHIDVEWEHSEPYYLLKCAAFRTRLQALPLFHEIKKEYPGALVIVDDVKPVELLETYEY